MTILVKNLYINLYSTKETSIRMTSYVLQLMLISNTNNSVERILEDWLKRVEAEDESKYWVTSLG